MLGFGELQLNWRTFGVFDDQVVEVADPTGAVLITPGSAEESSVYVLLKEGLMPKLGFRCRIVFRLRG